ncbi:MAG TPA: efflux RND transporter periplasmic adaptor subunit [Gemmatimonadaceae bacterium]|jgi:RND family efflux transporter MFP subunit
MSTHEPGTPHANPQGVIAEHDLHHPKAEAHHADVGAAPPVKPASTKRIVAIVTGVAVVLAALLVSSFIPRHATSRELEAEVAGNNGPPEVQTVQVVQAATGGDLTLPGTIQPLHEGAIYARVGGYVRNWHADIGRAVRAGDVLAEIDAPELDQQVEQAQQQLAQTRAALGLAKADLARWKSLAADSAVSREELDQKTAAYDAAVANSGAAEANVKRLTETQRFTKVTAPFNGVITARNIDIGSLISGAGATSAPMTAGGGTAMGPGSLFRIAQTDTVRMYISVPQTDALSMSPGMVADVTVQEIPNRTFTGHIVRTSSALDAASRTLLTEIDIVNPGLTLLSGMYAQVHLQLTHHAPSLIVPSTALVVRPAGPQVIAIDPAAADQTTLIHFKSVSIGRDFGGTVEVQSGLTAGMTVVSNPSADLVDGMKVKLAKRANTGTSAEP